MIYGYIYKTELNQRFIGTLTQFVQHLFTHIFVLNMCHQNVAQNGVEGDSLKSVLGMWFDIDAINIVYVIDLTEFRKYQLF